MLIAGAAGVAPLAAAPAAAPPGSLALAAAYAIGRVQFRGRMLLMFVILGVATGAKEKGIMAGVAVGAMVCLGALFGGPVSGASLNPARSLGPALVTGAFASLWLYLLAPCLGSWLAVGACRAVREPGCCR